MLPEIAPFIADALAKARLITISGGGGEGGAADATANNITSVIQTVLAAQLVARGNLLGNDADGEDTDATRRVSIPAVTGPASR
jgi:flotillin